MADVLEVVIFIHGVSNDLRGRPHTPEYAAIHQGIAARNPAWPTKHLGVEWGWPHTSGAPKSQELLTDGQRLLGSRVMPAVAATSDFTLNPARMVINSFRTLFFYGFADTFYYVSQNGKHAVRLAVAQQIVRFVRAMMRGRDEEAPLSLTLIGHSAGSVIAFDFLFNLFFRDPWEKHTFLDEAQVKVPQSTENGLEQLKRKAREGTLRVRRLFTFGSPIAPLACRSDAVVKILANDELLDPKDYGLTANPDVFPILEGPRWVNLWDRDDAIGWPVEPLMKQIGEEKLVEDVSIDVSDQVTKVHDAYWSSPRVHQELAEKW